MTASVGGIGYHFRAMKYASTFWQPFQKNLGAWLNTWRQKNEVILLIGPSAGYSLNSLFLNRYKKIYISEVDPLARILFRQRYSECEIETVPGDLLRGNAESLFRFLSGNPDVDILFCNLLGQMALLRSWDLTEFRIWIQNLFIHLHAKHFASYHDLFSFSGNFVWKKSRVTASNRIEDEVLLLEFLQLNSTCEITLEDHGLLNVLPADQREILHWEIIPNRHHLIECVVNPNSL